MDNVLNDFPHADDFNTPTGKSKRLKNILNIIKHHILEANDRGSVCCYVYGVLCESDVETIKAVETFLVNKGYNVHFMYEGSYLRMAQFSWNDCITSDESNKKLIRLVDLLNIVQYLHEKSPELANKEVGFYDDFKGTISLDYDFSFIPNEVINDKLDEEREVFCVKVDNS